MEEYKTINKNIISVLKIKNSTFITYLYSISDINNVQSIIVNLKKEHKKANHICYGYIYDTQKYAFDDKEPKNTAGTPILSVLEKNNLNYVLCVVVRYFGGILLGSSNLYKAYSTSTTTALSLTNIITINKKYIYKITFNYDKIKAVEKLLDKDQILTKIYNNNVTYIVNITKQTYDILNTIIYINITKGE